jgi:serine/threonine protein kinase
MVVSDFNSLFKLKGLLGVGAFGVVVLVKNRQNDQESALKIINKTTLTNEAIDILRNESVILQSMQHESIVKFK